MHPDDAGKITLVADSKISKKDEDGDDTWNRQVFRHALPKLRILRDDLAVGLAGWDIDTFLPRLNILRSSPVEELLELLSHETKRSFVVATLGPTPGLWQVVRGDVEDRLGVGRAWIGEPRANRLFTERYHQAKERFGGEQNPRFLLFGSMQSLVSFGEVDSVGGFVATVTSTRRGFRFTHDAAGVGPDEVNLVIDRSQREGKFRIEVPPGNSSHGYEVKLAVGVSPTIGALAYLIPEANTAWLFPDSSPWEARLIRTNSINDVLSVAAEEYGQRLVASPEP